MAEIIDLKSNTKVDGSTEVTPKELLKEVDAMYDSGEIDCPSMVIITLNKDNRVEYVLTSKVDHDWLISTITKTQHLLIQGSFTQVDG